jgi:hypothetical protein
MAHRSSYYISRDELEGGEYRVDDEAQLEIIGTIDAITRAQRKHLGAELQVSLLAAERYGPKEAAPIAFFGSMNLRASQRSALAYLPSRPFWALPGLMRGEVWISIGWKSLQRGYGEVASVFVGGAEERQRLLKLSGDSLITQP